MTGSFQRVVYLSGGVGGARLLEGLTRALPAGTVTALVNVADDFTHWGLRVCPDLDTVLYTLAGRSDMKRGWGLRGETFRALELARRYGGADWFALGDADLATHLMRTDWLREGRSLTEVTERLRNALGVTCRILPASNEPFATRIETAEQGVLPFQDWLVRHGGVPAVRRVFFEGNASATPEALGALEAAQVVIIGPSNPYVSIDPMLALPGLRAAVARRTVVCVSPIVAGRAIKGPLAEMIGALAGKVPSAGAIAEHYGALLAGMVVEQGDESSVHGPRVLGAKTVMRTARDRLQLARTVLSFASALVP